MITFLENLTGYPIDQLADLIIVIAGSYLILRAILLEINALCR